TEFQVGFLRRFEPPPGAYFWIDGEPPEIKNARTFDHREHSINLFRNMDYRKAVGVIAGIQALFPGGENTLRKEDAEFVLLEALLANPKKKKTLEGLIPESKDPARQQARQMIERILLSPVLKRVLCGMGKEFSFKSTWRSVIRAGINRGEL